MAGRCDFPVVFFSSLVGVKYLGRHHQHPVSGCAALCGSQLRNSSSCLLHSHKGTKDRNDPGQQVQPPMNAFRKELSLM